MSSLKKVLVSAAALLGAATPAHAGVAEIMTTLVTPLSTNATYSLGGATPLATHLGYRVEIANAGKNTSNSVRFTGATSVLAEASQVAEFDSAEGATCLTTNAAKTAISCAIGTLKSGQSFPAFFVFFKTPVKGSRLADDVAFGGTTYYAEGTGGPNSVPKNSTTIWTTGQVALGMANPTQVHSVVLRGGGTFFTGDGGLAAAGDMHATRSVVPTLNGAYTTADIEESGVTGAGGSPCTDKVFTCYSSQISIPGTFAAAPYLSIRLSQRIENIRFLPCKSYDDDDHEDGYRTSSTSTCTPSKRIPIEQIVITYLPDVTLTNPNPTLQTIGLCVPLAGPPPATGPCITNRVVVTDALGKPIRYEWTFISFQNGRLAIN